MYAANEGIGDAEYFAGWLAATYVGEVVRFVACVAALTFGGTRLVGALGLAAVGACVRGLGFWLLGVYGLWMFIGFWGRATLGSFIVGGHRGTQTSRRGRYVGHVGVSGVGRGSGRE